MIELINGISNQSVVVLLFMILNFFVAIFSIPLYRKKDIGSIIFVLVLVAILIVKGNLLVDSNQYFYKNLIAIFSFPLILLALPFYAKLISNAKLVKVYMFLLVVFFTLDLPFIRIFTNILLPQYSIYFTYLAGITNILSLYLLVSSNFNNKLSKALYIITYVNVLFSLAKWMAPVIIFSPFLFLYISNIQKKKSIKYIRIISLGLSFIFLIYVARDLISNYLGYSSFEDYFSTRVIKSSAFQNRSIEQSSLFGIADGNRINLYFSILKDYFQGDIIFGVELNYISKYKIPAHNFIIFQLSLLGIYGLAYIIKLIRTLWIFKRGKNEPNSFLIARFYTITVLFTFMVGESYGNIILLTFIFFNLLIMRNDLLLKNIH